jgi:MFS family permease
MAVSEGNQESSSLPRKSAAFTKLGVAAGAASLLFTLASTVLADGDHSGAPPATAPWWVWVLGLAILVSTVYAVTRQRLKGTITGEQFRSFSRNAKLLLIQSPFSGLTVSLMHLLFNLYLLALGFDVLFVAKYVALNWTFHGLAVIPLGILSDMFGRRRVYLVAYSGNILTTAVILWTLDPNWLLLLAAISGFCQGGHAILGAPFMREQSRPNERVLLFSLNGGIHVGAAGLGNLAAGVLPFIYAGLFGIGPSSAEALRASLLTVLPLMVCAVIPYILINEQWKPIDFRRWVKGIESYRSIGMLALTEGLVGLAMGFTTPFLNIFFHESLKASTDQIGLIFAVASVLTAVVTLFVPALVQRLGRVRTVTVVKLLGIPFLILLGLSPNIVWAGVFYALTILMIGGPFPNRGIADPIFSLFAMDVVKERERGTTNGIMHACVELPRGLGATLAGPLMAAGAWPLLFTIGGAAFASAFILYYLYFARIDARAAALEPAAAAAID